MALYRLCADVLLRIYSLTHSPSPVNSVVPWAKVGRIHDNELGSCGQLEQSSIL